MPVVALVGTGVVVKPMVVGITAFRWLHPGFLYAEVHPPGSELVPPPPHPDDEPGIPEHLKVPVSRRTGEPDRGSHLAQPDGLAGGTHHPQHLKP